MLVSLKTLRAAFGAIALASCAVVSSAAEEAHAAGSPYLEIVDPAEAMRSPAYRYANMTNEEAFAERARVVSAGCADGEDRVAPAGE